MIKRVFSPFFYVLLVISLAACSTAQGAVESTSDSTSAATSAGAETGAAETIEITESVRLAVGTLQLEETDLAVTEEQAAELLPLWQAARSLSTSDTITEAELDALYRQISGTMTDEQAQAIDEMELTEENLQSVMQNFGFTRPAMEGTPAANESAQAGELPFEMPEGFDPENMPEDFDPENMPARPEGGEMPAGGMPNGGGNFQGGGGGAAVPRGGEAGIAGGVQGGDLQSTPDSAMATRIAARGARAGAGINTMYVNILINLLSQRAGIMVEQTGPGGIPPMDVQETPQP
jgi:hypothetical protein